MKAMVAGVNAVWQMRRWREQTGYCGQTLEQHFGLGQATVVDSLWVRWPSGLIESFTDVPVDRYLTLTEGSGWAGVPPGGLPAPRKFGLLYGLSESVLSCASRLPLIWRQAGPVELAIYDLTGRRVATLVDAPREPGMQRVRWDGTGASSGAYFCRLRAGDRHGDDQAAQDRVSRKGMRDEGGGMRGELDLHPGHGCLTPRGLPFIDARARLLFMFNVLY